MGNAQTGNKKIKGNIQRFHQKKLNELTINGYIRQESAKMHMIIPNEIIKLVYSYYFALKSITINVDIIQALEKGTTLVINLMYIFCKTHKLKTYYLVHS